MRVLIKCERSGVIRDAFIARGHDAISCDLEPTEKPGPHIIGDAREIDDSKYDMILCNPECRYLCNSSAFRLHKEPGRWEKMEAAALFFKAMWESHCKRVMVENSIMHGYAKALIGPLPKQQIVQPYNFGADASKSTCLWLRGLPPLRPTKYIEPRWVDGKPRWSNQTDSGQNRLGPSPTRSMDRARTYPGIASAMAEQWGNLK
jgi:hypothetical protein